ncbi:MFS transporter [Atopomonas hussainii]|uniref:MFS transporter n=1 Tax=Atopomonas hussainii TaxID=1429083 RepID=UPI00090031C9|nr:MFS transporter [Atopomonas hussainii]
MTDSLSSPMTAQETRAATGLALVFAFRMLGMFMVLPVLATYGQDLAGATPTLIGIAIGAYGLTQALLQIPFGMVSDRIGRKPVIIVGMLLFAVGSIVAAQADSIGGVIAGRILQGCGAVSAAVMALLSDLTREQHRTKAMAMIGMSIGLSFAVAMIVGPLLTKAFGLSGLFWSTAGLALLGLLLVLVWVPTPNARLFHREASVAGEAMASTLRNAELLRLNAGIFILHGLLMASFVGLPLALVEHAGLPRDEHWWVYLTALLVSFVGMVPFIIYGEKQRQMKRVLCGAVAALLLVELYFVVAGSGRTPWVLGVIAFFTAFNLLEASMPSLVSKVAPAGGKGTAMGVYSTSQFLGAALGGMAGGWLYSQWALDGLFIACALLALIWLGIAVTMREPPYVTSVRLDLRETSVPRADVVARLAALAGVAEVLVIDEEQAAYLKVDSQVLDRAALEHALAGS